MSRSISVSRKAGLSEERGIVGTERVKPNWGCPAKKDLTIADFKPVGESSRYSMKQEACKTDAPQLAAVG